MNRLFNIPHAKARNKTVRVIGPYTRVMRVLAIVTCAAGISVAAPAHADCSFSSGSFQTGNVNMGNIMVPANVAVGSVIATKQMSFNSVFGQEGFKCGSNIDTALSFAMSGAATSGVYPTNISGIGIRIYAWSSTAYFTSPTTPTLTPNSWTFNYPLYTGSYGSEYLQLKVDLVATGPIDAGTSALSYNVAPWMSVATVDGTSRMSIANLSVTAQMTTRSCSVTTSSVAVTLPPAFLGNLNTGKTGATPFNLGLTCSAGAKVNVTLTDSSDISNTSTTLNLAPGSTAAGIGLQILNGSTPIAYGPDSPTAGNTNQWSAGTATGGAMNIPLTVQYIRTTGTLAGGTIKGLATFTMSYQ